MSGINCCFVEWTMENGKWKMKNTFVCGQAIHCPLSIIHFPFAQLNSNLSPQVILMNKSSRKMAVSGMMVALGAAVMLLGGVIPLATFCCPALAGLVLIPLVFDCGRTHAWSAWAAISLLGLMLCPDKEAALLFAFLGYYPILKWDIDVRVRNPWLRRLRPKLLGSGKP